MSSEDSLSRLTCARHLITSVGAETTNVARPAKAPDIHVLPNEDGLEGSWAKRYMDRLYVMKRRALRAP